MSTLVKENTAFIEKDCIFEHNGKAFESGGSYLLKRKDNGKYQGILYSLSDGYIGTWGGSVKVKATWGAIFKSNFYNCKRQYCWFTWEGHKMIGINYSVGWQDIINVREVK